MSEFYFYSTPLHDAIFTDNEKEVKKLLENNADINAKDDDNLSCYELAIEKQNSEIIKMIEKSLEIKNPKC